MNNNKTNTEQHNTWTKQYEQQKQIWTTKNESELQENLKKRPGQNTNTNLNNKNAEDNNYE